MRGVVIMRSWSGLSYWFGKKYVMSLRAASMPPNMTPTLRACGRGDQGGLDPLHALTEYSSRDATPAARNPAGIAPYGEPRKRSKARVPKAHRSAMGSGVNHDANRRFLDSVALAWLMCPPPPHEVCAGSSSRVASSRRRGQAVVTLSNRDVYLGPHGLQCCPGNAEPKAVGWARVPAVNSKA